ncbi:MAG: hypothetical protein ACSLFN_07400 [Candidatus Limnocylindrales bacterium]
MDPLFDLVRDRTQDLRRTADAARRERELRGSATTTPEPHPNAAVSAAVAGEVDVCAGPCLPAGTARAA